MVFNKSDSPLKSLNLSGYALTDKSSQWRADRWSGHNGPIAYP